MPTQSSSLRQNFVRPMGVLVPSAPFALDPRLNAILAEQSAAESRVIDEAFRPIGDLVNTDDSATVAQVVNQLDENPFAFACAYVNLSRFVKRMHRDVMELRERVDGLAQREIL